MPSLVKQAIDLFAASCLEVVPGEFNDAQLPQGARRAGTQSSTRGKLIAFRLRVDRFGKEGRIGDVLSLWLLLANAQERSLGCLLNG